MRIKTDRKIKTVNISRIHRETHAISRAIKKFTKNKVVVINDITI